MDALQSGSGGEDFAPDFVWRSAGHVGADGWSVEIRVPLENIRFRSGTDVQMGVLFWRRLSRSGVSASWPAMADGKWVFESNGTVVFRRASVAPPARNDSELDLFRQTGACRRVAVERHAGSRRFRHEREVRRDVGDHARRHCTTPTSARSKATSSKWRSISASRRSSVRSGRSSWRGLACSTSPAPAAIQRCAPQCIRRKIVDPSAGLRLTGAAGRHTFGVLSSADTSPDGERQRVFTVAREVMNFGRGRYVGLLMSDTEFGKDHNRVIGGDTAFKRGEHFQGNASFLSSRSRSLDGHIDERQRRPGDLRLHHAPLHSCGTGRALRSRLPHGHGVHSTASALTRGWQYQALNFYPSHPRYKWIKRINPFFWVSGAEDRTQGGTELFVLPAIRFNFTRAGFLRMDYGNGTRDISRAGSSRRAA